VLLQVCHLMQRSVSKIPDIERKKESRKIICSAIEL
jgi:hypothetical protein